MPVTWPDAQDQARPCRPTVSCTADIVAPGTLEVETGAMSSAGGRGPAHTASLPLLIKQTLSRHLQLQLGSNGYTSGDGPSPTRYVDNVFFGPKVHLVDATGPWPSLALSAQASVPISSSTGGAPHDDVFLTAFASKDLAAFHVDWNAGTLFWGVDDGAATQAFTALAVSPSLPSPFGAAVEGYYFTDAAPRAPRDGGVRVVGTLAARPWLVVDTGGDIGFFPATRAYSLFLGVTLIPVVLWRGDGGRSP
jgi:hypothetical protein